MKNENKAHRRTAIICWAITFALTMFFRSQQNAFLTYFFGLLTICFLIAASIFQSRIRAEENKK